jgi:hypothetical protein
MSGKSLKGKPRGSKRRSDKVKAGKASAKKRDNVAQGAAGGNATLRRYGHDYYKAIRLRALKKGAK